MKISNLQLRHTKCPRCLSEKLESYHRRKKICDNCKGRINKQLRKLKLQRRYKKKHEKRNV